MHLAAVSRDMETIGLIVKVGANVNAVADEGESPLDFAIKEEEAELTEILRKHGAKTGVELRVQSIETGRRP